jgi:hypothetical protein
VQHPGSRRRLTPGRRVNLAAAPAAAGAWVIPSGTVDGRGAAQTKRRLDAELTFYVVEVLRIGLTFVLPMPVGCVCALRRPQPLRFLGGWGLLRAATRVPGDYRGAQCG